MWSIVATPAAMQATGHIGPAPTPPHVPPMAVGNETRALLIALAVLLPASRTRRKGRPISLDLHLRHAARRLGGGDGVDHRGGRQQTAL